MKITLMAFFAKRPWFLVQSPLTSKTKVNTAMYKLLNEENKV